MIIIISITIVLLSISCAIFFPIYFKNKSCKKCINIINCNVSSFINDNNFKNNDTTEINNSEYINNNNNSNEDKNTDDINNEDKSSINFNNISIEVFNNLITNEEINPIEDKNSVNINNNEEEEKSNVINNNINEEEFDSFSINILDLKSISLTPKDGYDTIYIHLGGISEIPGFFTLFFTGKSTFIPKGSKIYYFAGQFYSKIKYNDEKFKVYNWFNVDKNGNLICNECEDQFQQAKESLIYIKNKIEKIHNEENIEYNKIYLGGFSQGAIMTNYVLLDFNHELGGYLAFSGYIFHHFFPPNTVETNLTLTQKVYLLTRKDYHILATHSFNDNSVPYSRAIESYYTYFKEYTDFKLFSFGEIGHEFDTQPTHPYVRKWLKERMGK